jgi:hypothetical protein
MNFQSETSRKIAIAVCVSMLLWGVGSGCTGFEQLVQLQVIRGLKNGLRGSNGFSNPSDLVFRASVAFAMAVISFVISWLLGNAIRQWKTSDSEQSPLFSPQAVALVGWLVIIAAAGTFCGSIFWLVISPQSLNRLAGPLGRLMRREMTLSEVSLVLANLRGAIEVAIGVLLVTEGQRNLTGNVERGQAHA